MDDAKGLDLTLVQAALAYWQRRLRLQDWHVTVEVVRGRKLDDLNLGECHSNLENKEAKIFLRDPIDYDPQSMIPSHPERTLVHELLHLHCLPFDPKNNTLEATALEQAINCIASALVTWEDPFSHGY